MKKSRIFVLIIAISILSVGIFCIFNIGNIMPESFFNIPKQYFSAADFKIRTVHSKIDFNKNGIDDYTDIMLGARNDAEIHPNYRSAYYAGGYPPDNEGVCTDVVWRAFKNAGYSLRDMVDKDIRENTTLYLGYGGKPDKNIDFRRVPNLKIYFGRKAISLTADIKKIAQFQPGDIIIYGNVHIAVISDRRNRQGTPYIIHNASQQNREEDTLNRAKISGHYRFDANRLKIDDLVKFKNK